MSSALLHTLHVCVPVFAYSICKRDQSVCVINRVMSLTIIASALLRILHACMPVFTHSTSNRDQSAHVTFIAPVFTYIQCVSYHFRVLYVYADTEK